jgi:hypothetical protein
LRRACGVVYLTRRMGLHEWLEELVSLHERAKESTLTDEGLAEYQRLLDEVGSVILAMQRLALRPTDTPRRSVRVRREMEMGLVISGGFPLRAKTVDLSAGGCAVLLGYAPVSGEPVQATLQLPQGVVLEVHGAVGAVRKERSDFRVSIVFGMLPQEVRAQLEFLVFDTVLTALRF